MQNGQHFSSSLDETKYYTSRLIQFYEIGIKSPFLLADLLGISSDYVVLLICRKYKIRPVDYEGQYNYKISDKIRDNLIKKGYYESFLK